MADGAANQSMDEILAQIRKIIAEDVPGSGKSHLALGGVTPPPMPVPVPAVQAQLPIMAPLVDEVPPMVSRAESTAAAPSAAAVIMASPQPVDDLSDLIDTDDQAVSRVTRAPADIVTTAGAHADAVVASPAALSSVAAPSAAELTITDDLADLAETPVEVAKAEMPEPLAKSTLDVAAALTPPPAPEQDRPDTATSGAPEVAEPVPAATLTATSISPAASLSDSLRAPTTIDPPLSAVVAPTVASQSVAPALPTPAPASLTSAAPAAIVAAPVALASLFANRIDASRSAAPGITVPTHIGRTAPPAAPATTVAMAQPAPSAIVAAPTDALGALGALAAGLAASGLAAPTGQARSEPQSEANAIAGPAPLPVATDTPPATAAASDASKTVETAKTESAPSVSTDEIMEAMRPILSDWLADHLPRALEGALRDALPNLISEARSAAVKKCAS